MNIHSLINAQPSKNINNPILKLNPYTSEKLHTFYSADLLEAVTAVQGAQKFFLEYRQSSFSDRLQHLQKIKAYLIENSKSICSLEALDQGLPARFVSFYALKSTLYQIEHVMAELSSSVKEDQNKYSPVGVISIIASWNLSLRVVAERLFPAIAAGNTVVIKISSHSPVTAFILTEMIQACGLPAGLIQIILSGDVEVKNILITHPGVKAVSFVGHLSAAADVIKQVASVSHQQFKKLQISAGTKNSAACLEEPVEGSFEKIMESFLIGQGQLAWNSSRLFILEKNEKVWQDRIKDYLAHLKPAESIEDTSPWTPVLRKESFKTFSEISQLAQSDQARLIKTSFNLSEVQKNNFLPITFTQDMSNCSTLQQDQVMSPLFILSTVKYPFDIQKYSNVSYFGFAAHLFGDIEKLNKVGDLLDVGLICKNKWSVEVFAMFKALKQSGFGLQDYRVFGDFFSNVKMMS
jgi:aminomuconate-semialdehyde/2-hydroxymuconate-6-semialdehyde dehydrogenase